MVVRHRINDATQEFYRDYNGGKFPHRIDVTTQERSLVRNHSNVQASTKQLQGPVCGAVRRTSRNETNTTVMIYMAQE